MPYNILNSLVKMTFLWTMRQLDVAAMQLTPAPLAGPLCPLAASKKMLMFWIKRLIPGVGRQAFVNPEHKQKLG